MKFYGELTKKLYETAEECEKAEAAERNKIEEAKIAKEKKNEERKLRAKEVEEAAKNANEANAKYRKLLSAFVRDFGSYHATFTSANSFFDDMFNIFF